MSLQVIDGGRLKEYMMIPGGNICPLLAVRGFRGAQPTATYRLSLTGNFILFLSWLNAGCAGGAPVESDASTTTQPCNGLHKYVLIKRLCNPLPGVESTGDALEPRVCLRHYPRI